MPNPTIRGNSAQIRTIRNGEVINVGPITNFQSSMDSEFFRTFGVGDSVGKSDQAINGWTGRFDLELDNPGLSDFINDMVTENLNGVGLSDYVIVQTFFYSDGQSRSFAFTDCVFRYSENVPTNQGKITASVDFQASRRTEV